MKLNEMAFAKAHAIVGGVFYVICWVWSMMAPASLVGVGMSWVHSLDLSSLPAVTPSIDTAIFGFVTWTVFAAAWGYFIAWAYNMAMKK